MQDKIKPKTTLPEIGKIFEGDFDFEAMARSVWAYQLQENPTLQKYCALLKRKDQTFVPISFFKNQPMRSGSNWEPSLTFLSSGTTGSETSKHEVKDAGLYRQSCLNGFRHFYGEGKFRILALLPNYLEKGHSSLVWMVQCWMEDFGTQGSGFFLHETKKLVEAIAEGKDLGERILLLGVSYAMLDFSAEVKGRLNFPPNSIIMETGGMKGRKREIPRTELHQILCANFGVKSIHSEYGMTELLSQAYAIDPGLFRCPPWMKVVITDLWLPGRILETGQVGRINIIDLTNLHSCAFIRTDDAGKMHEDGRFEVIGRIDNSQMRGCNLLYAGD